jgi:hypothetical protein
MFKEERDESQFEWSMLGDIEEGRPNLGPLVHVSVYRLMQYTLRDMLIRDFGVQKTDEIFFEAGKKAGQEYYKNVLTDVKDLNGLFADLQRTLKELGIAIFRVESAEPTTRDSSRACFSATRARTSTSRKSTAGAPGAGSVVSPRTANEMLP